METSPCRRFNLGDGMILIAALACWLAVAPGYLLPLPYHFLEGLDTALRLAGWLPWTSEHPQVLGWMTLHMAAHNVLHGFRFLFGYLVVAVLLIGFRRPREPVRDLIRQPGIGGCVFLVIIPCVYLEIWWLNSERFPYWIYFLFASALLYILLGRPPWRAGSGWIDRLGRAVAWYWVIAMFVWAVDEGHHQGAF
jgi:hypothetical protein